MKTSARIVLLAVASFTALALALALVLAASGADEQTLVLATGGADEQTLVLAAGGAHEQNLGAAGAARATKPEPQPPVAGTREPAMLDRYAGRYVAADGVELLVIPEEGALTLELPASLGASPLTLRATDAGSFFAVAEANTRVTFELDERGEARGLVLQSPRVKEAVAATRKPFRRGIVTVEDVGDAAASLAAIPDPH